MKIRKFVLTVCAAALLTASAASAAFAAGLGMVDFVLLEQKHPKFNSALTLYQTHIRQYRAEFTRNEKGKSDDQKRKMIGDYNARLDKERVELFGPIDEDILKLVQKVSAAKQLDYVVAKGAVIVGQAVDITNDVAAEIK